MSYSRRKAWREWSDRHEKWAAKVRAEHVAGLERRGALLMEYPVETPVTENDSGLSHDLELAAGDVLMGRRFSLVAQDDETSQTGYVGTLVEEGSFTPVARFYDARDAAAALVLFRHVAAHRAAAGWRRVRDEPPRPGWLVVLAAPSTGDTMTMRWPERPPLDTGLFTHYMRLTELPAC